MKVTAKRRTKSEAELLDYATNSLLRSLKRDMFKKEGQVDRKRLRNAGYSERLLNKLVEARFSEGPGPCAFRIISGHATEVHKAP